MIDNLFSYSRYINVILPVAPVIICFYRIASRKKPYIFICILLIISLVLDAINDIILHQFVEESTLLLHIYTLSEFIILALFYKNILLRKEVRKSLEYAIIMFTVFKIVDVMFITGTDKLDSLAITISSLFFTGLSLLFYWQMLQRLEVEAIERDPLFWINSGVLFYFAGNLITFMFSRYIVQQGYEYFVTHWLLHNFFSLFKYLAFSIGLWLLPRPQPIYHS